MILLCDTSTPVCRLTLIDGDVRVEREWQADRQLARGMLGWLNEQLAEQNKTWQDVVAIGAFSGPGSFTGLRIGLTILNTLADSLDIPIVGVTGHDWQATALVRLKQGENDRIALPFYSSDAHITTPRK